MKKYVYYKEAFENGREFIGVPGENNFWIRWHNKPWEHFISAGNYTVKYQHPKTLRIPVDDVQEYDSLDDPNFIIDML